MLLLGDYLLRLRSVPLDLEQIQPTVLNMFSNIRYGNLLCCQHCKCTKKLFLYCLSLFHSKDVKPLSVPGCYVCSNTDTHLEPVQLFVARFLWDMCCNHRELNVLATALLILILYKVCQVLGFESSYALLYRYQF